MEIAVTEADIGAPHRVRISTIQKLAARSQIYAIAGLNALTGANGKRSAAPVASY